jgi:hypothetical protein
MSDLTRTPSAQLEPGTRLRYGLVGEIVTLDRRKTPDDDHHGLPFHPGWWLRGRNAGGLADFVLDADDSCWKVVGWTP